MPYLGEPLTVSSLASLGLISSGVPAGDGTLGPGGRSDHFVMFQVQGMKNKPAGCLGYVSLTRRVSEDSAAFSLLVNRFLLNENPGSSPPLHHLQMTIHCENDKIASLKRLQMKSDFYRPDGDRHNTLCRQTAIEVSNRTLTVNTGKSSVRCALTGPITTDWGLFECVPRLAPEQADIADLTVLENMGIVKESQRLSYLWEESVVTAGGPQTIRCYKRLGQAAVPIEYWVSEDKRLWAVTCSSLVYLHQSVAAEAVPEPVMIKVQELLNR